jgi:hypothetical protein
VPCSKAEKKRVVYLAILGTLTTAGLARTKIIFFLVSWLVLLALLTHASLARG